MEKRDFYETLGVPRGASGDEIKKAYRRKARELHPDQNKDNPEAESHFKSVNEAYDVLKDPQKKELYDQFGHSAFEGGGPSGSANFSSAFSDVFEDFFGDLMGGGRRQGRRGQGNRGSDLRYDVGLELEEAFTGVRKRITVPGSISCESCNGMGTEGGSAPSTCPTCSGAGKVRAQQGFFTMERTCPTCSGAGQVIRNPCPHCAGAGRVRKDQSLDVDIPKGVETGSRIRLSARGEAGLRGGQNGDLYIFVNVRNHEAFERSGDDIHHVARVSMPQAALGCDIQIPTIDGGVSKVRIPAGSQPGKRLRLSRKGMPSLRDRNSTRGDMYVTLSVETPTDLSAEQKKLLERFEELSQYKHAKDGSLGEKVKGLWDDLKG